MPDTPPVPGERRDLQVTAQELGRWQGEVDAVLKDHGRHLDKINGSMEKVAERLGAIEASGIRREERDRVRAEALVTVERLRTKVFNRAVALATIFIAIVVAVANYLFN